MATCDRVIPLLQAYVDGELAQWEKLMVEHHVGECPMCDEELRETASASAALFETFSTCRLSAGFRDKVMNRLPVKRAGVFGVRRRNARLGGPTRRLESVSQLTLAGAVAVLVIALIIIVSRIPGISPAEIGVVTRADRASKIAHLYDSKLRDAVVRDIIFKGDRFVTNDEGRMILALEGPTEIRVNVNSQLWIDNERSIRLIKGEIWGHVAGESRVFEVQTPSGDIVVTGTEFNVKAATDKTTVTVATGSVVLRTTEGIAELPAGYSGSIEVGFPPRRREPVAVNHVGRWARQLVPETVDSRYSVPHEPKPELIAEQYLFIPHVKMRVLEVLIRRDVYGTDPVLLPGTCTINLTTASNETLLASHTLALSEFTGASERIRVDFSGDDIVVDEMFYVRFAPNEGARNTLRVREDIDDAIKYTGEKAT